jgi:hypothetical protein
MGEDNAFNNQFRDSDVMATLAARTDCRDHSTDCRDLSNESKRAQWMRLLIMTVA